MRPEVGQTICGELRIEGELPPPWGSRIFGPALVARDLSRASIVWLTVVERTLLPSQLDVSRFMAGANELLTVRHPTLLPVRTVDREADYAVVGYEPLLDAQTLASRIETGRVSGLAERLAVELARLLALLHTQGRHHGMLSPQAVIMRGSDVLLWQYGIAELVSAERLARACDRTTGDVCAPELRAGDPVSGKTDVYGWGATVAAALVGSLDPEAIAAVVTGSVEGVPEVVALVADALSNEPMSRPDDGLELLSTLAAILPDGSDRAGPTPGARARRYLDVIAALRMSAAPARPRARNGHGGPPEPPELAPKAGEILTADLMAEPPTLASGSPKVVASGGRVRRLRPEVLAEATTPALGVRGGRPAGEPGRASADEASFEELSFDDVEEEPTPVRPISTRAVQKGRSVQKGQTAEPVQNGRTVQTGHERPERQGDRLAAGRTDGARSPAEDPLAAALATDLPPDAASSDARRSRKRAIARALDRVEKSRAAVESQRDLELDGPPGLARHRHERLDHETTAPNQPEITERMEARRTDDRMARTRGRGPSASGMTVLAILVATVAAAGATVIGTRAVGTFEGLVPAEASRPHEASSATLADPSPPEPEAEPVPGGQPSGKAGTAGNEGRCPPGMVLVETGREDTCIEVRERVAADRMPVTGLSLAEARSACTDAGRRLCDLRAWRAACRGTSSRRYPYGDRLEPGRCFAAEVTGEAGTLGRSGERAGCVTPEGVFDLVGNAAEWVADGSVVGGDAATVDPTCTTRIPPSVAAPSLGVGFRCCRPADDPP